MEFDPFEVLDREGVGMMMKLAIEKGRTTRPDIKLGICGEHGGEASSVEFCHQLGLDYVSCSPYRVPIARLAAAQAAINESHQKKEVKRKPQKSKVKTSKAKVAKPKAAKTKASKAKVGGAKVKKSPTRKKPTPKTQSKIKARKTKGASARR